jgi:hypothetical protein
MKKKKPKNDADEAWADMKQRVKEAATTVL